MAGVLSLRLRIHLEVQVGNVMYETKHNPGESNAGRVIKSRQELKVWQLQPVNSIESMFQIYPISSRDSNLEFVLNTACSLNMRFKRLHSRYAIC